MCMKSRVAVYCRLSEEDKHKQSKTDDSNSIQNQKSMLLQYAMEQGWELYRVYSDDNYAGADRSRPEFNRLLQDARQRRFDIVLCKTQSRFTRELELIEKYVHGLFPVWGIRFISIVDHADTDDKGNKKSRQINGLINEWYLEDMSENIRSVLTSRRLNGFHIGAFALYGYRKDPRQKGHLLIDEEAAGVVREIFTLFSQGYGKTAIARILNDRGIPNPTEYKRLQGLRYRQPRTKYGTLWKYSAVSSMLINEMYIGNMVQGKYGSTSYKTKQNKPRPKEEWYVVEGTHEPIIDRELWERVQTLIAQKTKPFAVGTVGLFAGKARCANCGYAMRSSKSRGRYYLKCANRHALKDSCVGSFISADKLKELVTEELNRLMDRYLDKEELMRKAELCDYLQEQKNGLTADLAVYQKRAEESAKGIYRLYMDRINGVVSDADYMELSKVFASDRVRLEKQITDTQRYLNEIEEKIAAGESCSERIEQYTRAEHLTREMVELLVDHVEVGRRIPGTRDVPVVIYWDF